MKLPRLNASQSARLDRFIPFLLVALVLVVAIITVTPWPVGAFEDDAIYTVLAKSLATGEGYRMLNLPGVPHATHYPPGYPFLLSLLWRISPEFPDNIVLFKFANAVFLSLTALGAYYFSRLRLGLSRFAAAGAATVGTLSIVVLLVTGVVMSEPLFMALLFPALLLAERSADSGTVRDAVAAGLVLGILALVRTLGAIVIPAAALILVLRRKPLAAVALATAGAVVLLPWQLWVQAYQHEIPPVLMGKYGAYGPWLADGYRAGGLSFARGVIAANVQGIDRLLGYLFMPVRTPWPRTIAFAAVSALTLGGLGVFVRRASVTALFTTLYLIVVLLWPFEPDRFLLAIWPLLVCAAWAAVAAAWRWRAGREAGGWRGARRMVGWGTAAAALYVGAGFGAYNFRGYRERWWASVQRDAGLESKPIAEWVVRHAAMDDVLSTEHDLIIYLYTGRRAVPTSTFLARERVKRLTQAEEKQAIRTLLLTYRPRFYITSTDFGLRAADELSAEQPALLRRMGNTRNALVYERVPQ